LVTIDESGLVDLLESPASRPADPTPRVEAMLDANGQFRHSEGEAAAKTARERIRNGASTGDSARSGQRRRRGAETLDAWHPVTAGRLTIVDRFEENGQRYVVAREDETGAAGFDALTDRERQVVVKAALGSSNKEIAGALGISEATVRVLMARGAHRLGVHTRKALLEHPALGSLRRRD